MPEVIINGPAGRIEGRYHHEPAAGAPSPLFSTRILNLAGR